MEENLIMEEQNNEFPKRPQFLTVLCILSYIWSGIVILSLFFCLIFSGLIFSSLQTIASGENGMPQLNSIQIEGIDTLLKLGKAKFVAIIAFAIIAYMTSLLGVFKMWRLQKWGFYIYASINGLGLTYDIINGSFFMSIISLSFIVMYFMNLKHMK
jgi:hypothetical protein